MPKRHALAGLVLLCSGCTLDGNVTLHKPTIVRGCNGPVYSVPSPVPSSPCPPTYADWPAPLPPVAPVIEAPAVPVEAVPAPTSWRPVRSD